MLAKRKPIPLSNLVPALEARTQFGRILKLVERERRSFVVEKRGSPKGIILSIADYIKLAAFSRSGLGMSRCPMAALA
jgi:prevent-host-death family protein